jgi:hypothetical protein
MNKRKIIMIIPVGGQAVESRQWADKLVSGGSLQLADKLVNHASGRTSWLVVDYAS